VSTLRKHIERSERKRFGIVHPGASVLREIHYGIAEPVLGDEYVLTDERTKRSFLCVGDERVAASICDEILRLESAHPALVCDRTLQCEAKEHFLSCHAAPWKMAS
jgi:hypothetical protein